MRDCRARFRQSAHQAPPVASHGSPVRHQASRRPASARAPRRWGQPDQHARSLEYPLPVRRFAAVPLLSVVALTMTRLAGAPVWAQDSAIRFEVASVKPNVGQDLSIPFRPSPPDGITLTNNPLDSIIRYAY